MSRKVFLSFLGTTPYKECKYVSEQFGESGVLRFVQQAIFELHCKDFSENDVIYIFLTKGAEETNWAELEEYFIKQKVNLIPIKNVKEGYIEQDIWNVFEMVYENLQKNDQVFLDITHGFRILPMLTTVLLSYAKALKNIEVCGIFYGAFEALGPARLIDEKYPNPKDRKAPLLNLLSFSALQDWTEAAFSFIKTGNPNSTAQLTQQNINPILEATAGKDQSAALLRNIITGLEKGERVIATNRGNQILKSDHFLSVTENIKRINAEENAVIKPLRPLLDVILSKLQNFKKDSSLNWLAAAHWCLQHGMEQQAITQLQEGIITYICLKNKFDFAEIKLRELVSQAFYVYYNNTEFEKWKNEAKENREKIEKLISSIDLQNLSNSYASLTQIRNDINHAGYKKHSSSDPKSFKRQVEKIINEVQHIISGNEDVHKNVNQFLLNLSNHPSSAWSEKQLQTAIAEYGAVQDLPFPHISPHATEDEINELVNDYFNNIVLIHPAAIHLMGELTFSYRLIQRLQLNGYKVIASTTTRNISYSETGEKISKFEFTQFRNY